MGFVNLKEGVCAILFNVPACVGEELTDAVYSPDVVPGAFTPNKPS